MVSFPLAYSPPSARCMPYLIILGRGIWDGDVQRSPEGGEVSHIEGILLQSLFLGTAQSPPLISHSLPSIPFSGSISSLPPNLGSSFVPA